MIKEHYKLNLILILVRLDSCQASTCTHRLRPYNRFDPNVSNIAPIIDLTMIFFLCPIYITNFEIYNLKLDFGSRTFAWFGMVVPKLFNTSKQRWTCQKWASLVNLTQNRRKILNLNPRIFYLRQKQVVLDQI